MLSWEGSPCSTLSTSLFPLPYSISWQPWHSCCQQTQERELATASRLSSHSRSSCCSLRNLSQKPLPLYRCCVSKHISKSLVPCVLSMLTGVASVVWFILYDDYNPHIMIHHAISNHMGLYDLQQPNTDGVTDSWELSVLEIGFLHQYLAVKGDKTTCVYPNLSYLAHGYSCLCPLTIHCTLPENAQVWFGMGSS